MSRLIYSLIILFLLSCMEPPEEFELENKYDPQNLNYIKPVTTISSGPTEGETITTEQATFAWVGNDATMEFRVHNNNILLQDWSGITSYTLNYLDEGEYDFSVQGRYANEDTSLTVHINFIVDAVEGPALIFLPRRQIAAQGQGVAFEIIAEEVNDLSATEFVLRFDQNLVTIDSINAGSMFKFNQDFIFHKKIDNSSGSANLLIGLLGGDDPAFSGTGSLAIIYLTKKTTTETTIIFDGSETFRGPLNNIIQINTTIGGLISNE